MRKANLVRTLSIALLTLGSITVAHAQPTPLAGPPDPTPTPSAPIEPPPPTPSPAVVVVATQSAPTRSVLVSAKLGGIIPFDGLSPFVSLGLELGYVLPVANHRLAIVLDVDYTQPTKTGSESDPRVLGGTYTWKLTEQELGIMPALLFRFTNVSRVVPYVGIGPRILLARSTVRDNGTPVIMETHEQSTRLGVGVPLGLELPVGPGRLIGEVLLQYGTLNHVATGDANTGAASVSVGFRMLF